MGSDIKQGFSDKAGRHAQIAVKTTLKLPSRMLSSCSLLLENYTMKNARYDERNVSVSKGFSFKNTSRETLLERSRDLLLGTYVRHDQLFCLSTGKMQKTIVKTKKT